MSCLATFCCSTSGDVQAIRRCPCPLVRILQIHRDCIWNCQIILHTSQRSNEKSLLTWATSRCLKICLGKLNKIEGVGGWGFLWSIATLTQFAHGKKTTIQFRALYIYWPSQFVRRILSTLCNCLLFNYGNCLSVSSMCLKSILYSCKKSFKY